MNYYTELVRLIENDGNHHRFYGKTMEIENSLLYQEYRWG